VFSKESGLYSKPFELTITTKEEYTIYYSIDGSEPLPSKAGKGRVFKYTSPIKIIDRNNPVQSNLLATPENSEKFYPHKDDPVGGYPVPYIPGDARVPKATVIRAAVFDASSGRQSDIVTMTYFISGNLDAYASHPVMSFVTDPYNLIDEDYGILVRGKDTNRGNAYLSETNTVYNFARKGEEWERAAVMELFTGDAVNRKVSLSTKVGLRVRGWTSRANAQKSFNVYFRQEHGGINNLKDFILIPGAVQANGKPVTVYKSFMLRNGGNDTEQTKLYDVFIQKMFRNREFTTQAAVPCVVYLNGEYWGFYNMQERYSDNHTEYKYGVNRNNVISFDNNELDDGNKGEESLFWDMMEYANQSRYPMSSNENYAAFREIFDIQNFAEYFAANLYINNVDWPGNNYRLWRTRVKEQGNIYGDTKWRWQMFDTEFSMGYYKGGLIRDPFDEANTANQNYELFRNLLTNSGFRRLFINAMMDIYNIDFHPDNYIPELTVLADTYRPLMADYSERFTGWNVFDEVVNNAKKYLQNIRIALVDNYLPKQFPDIGELKTVTLYAKDETGAPLGTSITINTTKISLEHGGWQGQYFSGYPISLTVDSLSGYSFADWEITGGVLTKTNESSADIELTGDLTVTVIYKKY